MTVIVAQKGYKKATAGNVFHIHFKTNTLIIDLKIVGELQNFCSLQHGNSSHNEFHLFLLGGLISNTFCVVRCLDSMEVCWEFSQCKELCFLF